jgi:hypothetical protein
MATLWAWQGVPPEGDAHVVEGVIERVSPWRAGGRTVSVREAGGRALAVYLFADEGVLDPAPRPGLAIRVAGFLEGAPRQHLVPLSREAIWIGGIEQPTLIATLPRGRPSWVHARVVDLRFHTSKKGHVSAFFTARDESGQLAAHAIRLDPEARRLLETGDVVLDGRVENLEKGPRFEVTSVSAP